MKKSFALLLYIMIIAILVSGCGGSNAPAVDSSKTTTTTTTDGETVSSRDRLVIATHADPGRLRSDTVNNLQAIPWNRLIYDYLFTRNAQGEYVPGLCEEYQMDDDNLGVTLELREGVKFHSGNVMTADDVLASLIYGKQDTGYGNQLDFIDFDNSEVIDANTLYLKFKTVNGVWQNPFLAIGIIEKEAYEAAASPDEFYLNPMTTSSYVLEDWVSGDSLTFKAFPEFWDGAPKIETIVLRIISESSVALMELQTGGVDVIFNMSLENYNAAIEDDRITGFTGQPSTVSVFLGQNLKNEALNKLEVRQALAYAIDLDAIVNGAFDSAATPCYSPLGQNALGYDGQWENNYPYFYNPEKGRELLEKAGYGDGLNLRILVDETPSRQLMAEQLYNMFADIGVTVQIEKYDLATASDILTNSDNYDLYIRGASQNSGDIVTFLATSAGFSAVNVDADTVNGGKYREYMDKISGEVDTASRIELYKEFQKSFLEELMYWVPGVQMTLYSAYNSDLVDIEMPGQYWEWHNAYFK